MCRTERPGGTEYRTAGDHRARRERLATADALRRLATRPAKPAHRAPRGNKEVDRDEVDRGVEALHSLVGR